MFGKRIFEGTIASMGVQSTPTASGVCASATPVFFQGHRYQKHHPFRLELKIAQNLSVSYGESVSDKVTY